MEVSPRPPTPITSGRSPRRSLGRGARGSLAGGGGQHRGLEEARDGRAPPNSCWPRRAGCRKVLRRPISAAPTPWRHKSRPALLPQVYLHYAPPIVKTLCHRLPLPRQRMDFLLLLPGRQRIVLEVDGKHHFSEKGPPVIEGLCRHGVGRPRVTPRRL